MSAVHTEQSPAQFSLAKNFSPSSYLRASDPLDAIAFEQLRRRAMLEGCKWDAQVGDVNTLAPFPLIMKRSVWKQIATLAEMLTAEMEDAEREIISKPKLLPILGLPRTLQTVLEDQGELSPSAGRVVRYDFHVTTHGWQISEANSDVPGGFTESSFFTEMMSQHFPQFEPAGNPIAEWVRNLAKTIPPNGNIALLSAPGYLEDHQVVAFLARHLGKVGYQTHLANPLQVTWHEGKAYLNALWHRGPLDGIIRFYQAEWLAKLPKSTGWQHFFRDGKTPVANPPLSIISESKRFPLTWKYLQHSLPTWNKLLPETCDPREVSNLGKDDWLLKTTMCNTGDTVSAPQWMSRTSWWQAKLMSRLFPRNWIAQKRFESVPVLTPFGPLHPCVGVYTINGRTAGAYVRLSKTPLVDFSAMDAALLLENDE